MENIYLFNQDIAALLSVAGWYRGRKEGNSIPLPKDVIYPAQIKAILDEFGGLFIKSQGAGIEIGRSSIKFDPMDADGESKDGSVGYYSELLTTTLYPLGYLPSESFIVCIDMDGRVFLTGDDCYLVGNSFPEGISNILSGVKGKRFKESTRGWWED